MTAMVQKNKSVKKLKRYYLWSLAGVLLLLFAVITILSIIKKKQNLQPYAQIVPGFVYYDTFDKNNGWYIDPYNTYGTYKVGFTIDGKMHIVSEATAYVRILSPEILNLSLYDAYSLQAKFSNEGSVDGSYGFIFDYNQERTKFRTKIIDNKIISYLRVNWQDQHIKACVIDTYASINKCFFDVFSAAVKTGSGENIIRIDHDGKQLTVFINNQKAGEFTLENSKSLYRGKIGLYADRIPKAEKSTEGPVRITVDDFTFASLSKQ